MVRDDASRRVICDRVAAKVMCRCSGCPEQTMPGRCLIPKLPFTTTEPNGEMGWRAVTPVYTRAHGEVVPKAAILGLHCQR